MGDSSSVYLILIVNTNIASDLRYNVLIYLKLSNFSWQNIKDTRLTKLLFFVTTEIIFNKAYYVIVFVYVISCKNSI